MYVKSVFSSKKDEKDFLTINRMGTFTFCGKMETYFKEFVQLWPFGKQALKYIFFFNDSDLNTQTISIELQDLFDNTDFQLKEVKVSLLNKNLHYRSAEIRF